MANGNVVLAHDWITSYRGGERVLEAFAQMFPEAPIYTLIHKKGSGGPTLENRHITASTLNQIPSIDRHYPKFLPTFPAAVAGMKIKESAELFLSSSHCVIKGLQKPKGSTHVSYIHSPMRYIYDQFDNYFGPSASLPQRIGGKVFRGYLTKWDQLSNKNVDHMIANSWFVHNRIKKHYQRDSVVIHPFVELADFRHLQQTPVEKEDYFLVLGAFTPNKRVDLAIEAFNLGHRKLKIIGSGHHESALSKIAGPNIEFLGNLPRPRVLEHLQKARALIFPGVEDFGITPLESLAAGTPVIAYHAGGVIETMTEDTALFFYEPTAKALADAVDRFEGAQFKLINLFARAENFSKEMFTAKTLAFLNAVVPGFSAAPYKTESQKSEFSAHL